LRIGHNEQFDARIMRIAMMRYGMPEVLTETFRAGATECTQRLATPIMKLPPTAKMVAAGRHHAKSANLSEAYQYFIGKPLEDAHSAMVDVLACAEVYWAIQDRAAAAAA
jgi:DNA polymerase-3 subunit epsilon